MSLEQRTLGSQGLEVSVLGLGCIGMSQSYGTPEERDERERVKYLEENVAAASVALDAAQMQALDAALAPGKVAGPRYNSATMATIDR
jgi:aryl-alcohol dehydrogenase-like predicted oxidoreductase